MLSTTEAGQRGWRGFTVSQVGQPRVDEPIPPTELKLGRRAFEGEPLTVVFDLETCARQDLGNIECGVEYSGRYDRRTNRWTVTGPGKVSKEIITSSADNADPRPGWISVWGMISSFDDNGDLKYLGRKAGRIALDSRPGVPSEQAGAEAKGEAAATREPKIMARAFEGEPLTVVFDPEICARQDLGNIECGVEYSGRYDRQTNRWTVTGPGKVSKEIITSSADNADPRPGWISVWGMISSFDDNGDLKYLGRKAGRIALDSRPAVPPEQAGAEAKGEAAATREPKIMARAFEGEPVTVVFDPETCSRQDLGNIECGVEYTGRYAHRTNRWTVTGPGKISKEVVTFSADNADPRPGWISVWGMISSFDDNGDLKYLGRKVGRIALDNRPAPPERSPQE